MLAAFTLHIVESRPDFSQPRVDNSRPNGLDEERQDVIPSSGGRGTYGLHSQRMGPLSDTPGN